MRTIVVSPSGVVFDQEARYVLASGNNGQLGILKNHIPIVVPISRGFVKIEHGGEETFIVIENGILEQSDNVITVIAQEAIPGENQEDATNKLLALRKIRKEENKRRMMDFVQMEQDLKKTIKEANASNL